MDFLNQAKKFASESGGNFSGGNQSNNNNAGAGVVDQGAPPAGNTNNNAGQEDYGDKGLDFIEKKTGHTFSREQNEKITDGARGMFEKFSGKKVDPKYSN